MRVSIMLAAGLLACSKPSAPGSQPVASAAPLPPPAAVEASVAQPQLTEADVTRLLKADLGHYAGGSSFEFLRNDWAPRIERYLTLRDAPVDALIGQARAFYAG